MVIHRVRHLKRDSRSVFAALPSEPKTNPHPRRIAVLRALQLGDMLCAVPVLRALRVAFPDAQITLIGLPWAAELVAHLFQYLDDFLPFPGFPGLPEQPCSVEELPAFLAAVQKRRFDLVLQLQGDGSITNLLVALFGARNVAGFKLPGQFCPDPERFVSYPDHGPEVRRLLAVLPALRIAEQGDHLEWPLCSGDHRWLAERMAPELAPGSYVCLHVGGRSPQRRWSPEGFARVGDALWSRGLKVVLTGVAAERPLAAEVAARMASPVLDLTGRTRLGELALLLHGARLLISNDTGVAHLGVAVDVPSVVLFDPSQEERWAPLDRWKHRVVSPVASASPDAVLAEAAPWIGDTQNFSARTPTVV
jgi:ADP-heptose:LPS heptosyltransferase